MKPSTLRSAVRLATAIAICWQSGAVPFAQSDPDGARVIHLIDSAVQHRFDQVLGFTDVEHYQVFRGSNESTPAAEMTVKTSYKKGVGKSYEILSRSGSEVIQHFGLEPLLNNEKTINIPGKVERSWFNSANYEMTLSSANVESHDGRSCYVLNVTARNKASNAINGRLWVDVVTGNIVKLDGVATKNPSVFSGSTHMMRQYTDIDSFPMATHDRAESISALFGRTVVTIDYAQYHLDLAPSH